jgi:hypothetical protein
LLKEIIRSVDRMKKRWLAGIMTLLFILVLVPSVLAANPLTVKVDGKNVFFPDAQPYINQDSRTMVPIRFISEELGAQVVWNQADNKVEIHYNGKLVVIVIDQFTYYVDGQALEMDTRAIILNYRTMVPIRFISQALGAGVIWDADTNSVIIATVPVQPHPSQPPVQSIGDGKATIKYTAGAMNFKKISLTNVSGVNDAAKYMVSETPYLTGIGVELIFLPEGSIEAGAPTTTLRIYNSSRQLVGEGTITYPTGLEVGKTVTLTVDIKTY